MLFYSLVCFIRSLQAFFIVLCLGLELRLHSGPFSIVYLHPLPVEPFLEFSLLAGVFVCFLDNFLVVLFFQIKLLLITLPHINVSLESSTHICHVSSKV